MYSTFIIVVRNFTVWNFNRIAKRTENETTETHRRGTAKDNDRPVLHNSGRSFHFVTNEKHCFCNKLLVFVTG